MYSNEMSEWYLEIQTIKSMLKRCAELSTNLRRSRMMSEEKGINIYSIKQIIIFCFNGRTRENGVSEQPILLRIVYKFTFHHFLIFANEM